MNKDHAYILAQYITLADLQESERTAWLNYQESKTEVDLYTLETIREAINMSQRFIDNYNEHHKELTK